jgi:hypothetical protein
METKLTSGFSFAISYWALHLRCVMRTPHHLPVRRALSGGCMILATNEGASNCGVRQRRSQGDSSVPRSCSNQYSVYRQRSGTVHTNRKHTWYGGTETCSQASTQVESQVDVASYDQWTDGADCESSRSGSGYSVGGFKEQPQHASDLLVSRKVVSALHVWT